MNSIGIEFINKTINRFNDLKTKSEKSIGQVNNDHDLYWLPDGESNSIAILVKHLAGNMRSRWTNIFEEDGEKSDRNRPAEFDQKYNPTREQLMDRWEEGWEYLFSTLNSLTDKDLMREIYIRKEAHTVIFAIIRQLAHYAEHVGQIIFLAKLIEWKNWESLSIPREKKVADYKDL